MMTEYVTVLRRSGGEAVMSDEVIGCVLLLAMALVVLNVAGLLWLASERPPKRRSS